jgi:methionyl-tRNA formyltransferase
VLTQPDRPAGRGLRSSQSAVKALALRHGLDLHQPASLKDEAALDRVAAARPQALVVAAYGLILPQRALDIAAHGALNVHASLLPRWRGAAPIQRALLAGDRETGISIIQMDAGLDTGAILLQQSLAIAADDDAQSLHDRLAALGAKAIVAVLAEVAAGRVRPVAQPEAGVSYARKIGKAEAELDWSRSCEELERTIRALRPSPGARSRLRGESIKLWRARCSQQRGKPGSILDGSADGMLVACGEGALQVTEMQRAGGTRLAAAEFLRGHPVQVGEQLGAAR